MYNVCIYSTSYAKPYMKTFIKVKVCHIIKSIKECDWVGRRLVALA